MILQGFRTPYKRINLSKPLKVAIIDADFVGKKKHRFPNLVSMKLSGYYKELGNDVELKLDYEDLWLYDKVFISKVFTDTPIDENILQLPNVEYGGTGFFYDKAPKLPYEVEHHMPDYHLYDEWVQQRLDEGGAIEMISNTILIIRLDSLQEVALGSASFV